MHQPQLLAIDGDGIAGAPGIDRMAHPGRLALCFDHREQPRRADEGRQVSRNLRQPDEFRPDRLACQGAGAVAADGVAPPDREALIGVEVANGGDHLVFGLRDVLDLRAVENGDTRLRGRVVEQDRFEIELIDPVRRLGRWPP